MSFAIFTSKQTAGMIRTLIIDDESHIRKTLVSLLSHFCPQVVVLDEADGVESGLASIIRYNPELVMLDIRMKDGTGFDLLNKLPSIDFKVIFITAFDQYAVQAFKFSAVDYLLKPVDPDDLVKAVSRSERMMKGEIAMRLKALEENLLETDPRHKKLVVRTSDNIYLLNQSDVLFCASDGSYTTLFLRNGQQIITSRLLKDFDDMLSGSGFYRVHKSFLVNLAAVERFEKAEGGFLILSGEHKIPVASRKRDDLIALFDKLI